MDISHAESAHAQGTSSYEEWYARQEEQWNRPVIRTQIAVFLASLTPEQREAYGPQIEILKDRLGLKEKEDASTDLQWTGAEQQPPTIPGGGLDPALHLQGTGPNPDESLQGRVSPKGLPRDAFPLP